MKSLLKFVGLLMLVGVIGVGYLAWITAGVNASMKDGEMAGSGKSVIAGYSQAFVIYVGDGEVALVDTGNDPEATALKAELERRKLPIEAVKTILLTHGHPDHVSGVSAFSNAQVFALAAEADYLSGDKAYGSPAMKVMSGSARKVQLTRTLQDGEVLPLGRHTVKVYSVPGHSAGSAAYLIDKVLYLGDAASADRNGAVINAPWVFSEDTERSAASLKMLYDRVKGEEIKSLAFGHSAGLGGLEPLQAFADALR